MAEFTLQKLGIDRKKTFKAPAGTKTSAVLKSIGGSDTSENPRIDIYELDKDDCTMVLDAI
jgi:hypothetical protein